MWISPDEFVLEPHSDKNKARQRGCDLGTAGEKFLEENSWVESKGMVVVVGVRKGWYHY